MCLCSCTFIQPATRPNQTEHQGKERHHHREETPAGYSEEQQQRNGEEDHPRKATGCEAAAGSEGEGKQLHEAAG